VKNSLGKVGEEKAVQFLKENKFKILERNYRTPFGEIDIIAQKSETLYFVEVKTRSSILFGRGSEAIGETKIRHIKNSINFYLKGKDVDYKIAVIDILKSGDTFEINFFTDIF